MKAITITIPEELDAAAAAEATRCGVSKSELIRRGLSMILPAPVSTNERDPWVALAGFASGHVAVEPGDVDEVVYGS